MTEFLQRPHALPPLEVERLRQTWLASPLVGRSTLAGSFQHSRGFAVIFTRDGRDEVEQRFPGLRAFLPLAMERAPQLTPWKDRILRRPRPEPNAFYVNLLLVGAGGGVGRHTDATLREWSSDPELLPLRVSVLYLGVPATWSGGHLQLFRDQRQVASIAPREGTLVHFRGDLAHEVTKTADRVESTGETGIARGADAQSTDRVSLVCEQYRMSEADLAAMPTVRTQSKAGFGAYLQHFQDAQTASPPTR